MIRLKGNLARYLRPCLQGLTLTFFGAVAGASPVLSQAVPLRILYQTILPAQEQ